MAPNDSDKSDAAQTLDSLNVGDVIRLPKFYTNALAVVETTAIGIRVEFVDDALAAQGTSKDLIRSIHTGEYGLVAGTADKGTVWTVEVVARGEDDEDDAEETEVRADGGTDLPTHDSVEDYAEDVGLSDLSDDDLDGLDDRVGDLLNGDPYEFPTDTALSAAFSLSTAIRDEKESRDPRRSDPYFHPGDTEERFALPITSVEVYEEGDEVRARFTLDESGIDGGRDASEWRLRPETEIAATVLDYYGMDDLRELGTVVGDTLPVVGADRSPWGRVDRYALEHGTPAVETDNDDTPEVRTDGGENTDDDGGSPVADAAAFEDALHSFVTRTIRDGVHPSDVSTLLFAEANRIAGAMWSHDRDDAEILP